MLGSLIVIAALNLESYLLLTSIPLTDLLRRKMLAVERGTSSTTANHQIDNLSRGVDVVAGSDGRRSVADDVAIGFAGRGQCLSRSGMKGRVGVPVIYAGVLIEL